MYRLFFQKSKQPKLNIEKWVILSSSLPPDWTISPLSDALRLPYANETQDRSTGCAKKECTGLDREQPFQVLFLLPHSPAVLSSVVRHVRTSKNGSCFPCLFHTDSKIQMHQGTGNWT